MMIPDSGLLLWATVYSRRFLGFLFNRRKLYVGQFLRVMEIVSAGKRACAVALNCLLNIKQVM